MNAPPGIAINRDFAALCRYHAGTVEQLSQHLGARAWFHGGSGALRLGRVNRLRGSRRLRAGEKLLGNALSNMLKQVQNGAVLAPASAGRAASYAVRIADATGKGRWVDYCFELYAAQARTLPSDVVDQLYVVLRKISGVAISGFRAYLERLKAASSTFSPTERFVMQRIEGLERLILR